MKKLLTAFSGDRSGALNLHLKGTNFQVNVWEALLRIPAGAVVFYQEIATTVCSPAAVRAVANAVAGRDPRDRGIWRLPIVSPRKKAIPPREWQAASLG